MLPIASILKHYYENLPSKLSHDAREAHHSVLCFFPLLTHRHGCSYFSTVGVTQWDRSRPRLISRLRKHPPKRGNPDPLRSTGRERAQTPNCNFCAEQRKEDTIPLMMFRDCSSLQNWAFLKHLTEVTLHRQVLEEGPRQHQNLQQLPWQQQQDRFPEAGLSQEFITQSHAVCV